ncbi:MAG: hypothetical protein WA160_02055 [Pseudobdellovibrio sp.]
MQNDLIIENITTLDDIEKLRALSTLGKSDWLDFLEKFFLKRVRNLFKENFLVDYQQLSEQTVLICIQKCSARKNEITARSLGTINNCPLKAEVFTNLPDYLGLQNVIVTQITCEQSGDDACRVHVDFAKCNY